MGPAGLAGNPPNGSNSRLPAALQAFPSPASITASLDSPTLSRTLAGGRSPALWTPRSLLADASNVLPTEPAAVADAHPAMTPPADCRSEPDMNLLVGGALAPVHTSPPQRPQPRAGPGLRLPSFEALGIAAPHPDRFDQQSLDGAMASAETILQPLGVSHADSELLEAFQHLQAHSVGGASDVAPVKMGGRAVQSPVQHFITTLTPPAEAGEMIWPSMTTVASAPMESPSTDPGHPIAPVELGQTGAGADAPGSSTAPNIHVHSDVDREDESWLDGALQALLENLRSAPLPSNPLRVLSHALPSPSSTGHVFPSIINAIHTSTPTSPTVWINVFHAIPGRFNLADLPTSPPSTPGPPIGGEDYFTQKVFDSAVPISDYQEDLSSLPRSPRPIVPPSSINVSVVERYLPPTSPNEFADMFNTNGPSILVDRLVELSPNNGSLAFIYPTKTGAKRFMQDYLGPLLDPLLRTMCVVHGLSSDLSRSLGGMAAVDKLLEHAEAERLVSKLCATLTQRSTSMHRFHGRRAHFSVAYSGKKEVPLSREVWARDWWTKQEKPRVREVVTRYAQEAQKKSSNEHVERPATPAELIQSLLDNVVKRKYPDGKEPVGGIEVSVFVIKRSE